MFLNIKHNTNISTLLDVAFYAFSFSVLLLQTNCNSFCVILVAKRPRLENERSEVFPLIVHHLSPSKQVHPLVIRISYTLASLRLYHAPNKNAIDFSVKCQKVKDFRKNSAYRFLSFSALSISRLASFLAKS